MSATWVRAQAFGQPLTLMVMSASMSPSRSSRWATTSAALAFVSTMASLQNSMPVQAMVPRRQVDGSASRPSPRSAVDQRVDPVVVDVEHQELLVRGQPHPAAAVRLGQVGDAGQQRAADPAGDRGHPDEEAAVALRGARRCGRSGSAGSSRRRAVEELAAAGTRPPAPRGTAPRPSRPPGTSAGPGCAAGGSRSRGRCRPRRPTPRAPRPAGPRRPRRWASIGLVDRPPPTQRSKPGPCSGCTTPRNAMSLASYGTSGSQETTDLNLRGRLENALSPMYRSTISRMAGVASRTSSAQIPATGLPRTRAGCRRRPRPWSGRRPRARCQIAGTSSMRTQCSWTFCRSVRSAVSRPYSRGHVGDRPQLVQVELPAVDADRGA